VQSLVRFNRVPEKVPEKVWEALVQSQIRFNRVPGKVPEKVPEKVPGSLCAKPSQVQRVPEKVPEKVPGSFGKPSQVQRVLEKVAEKVPEKVLGIFGAGPGHVQKRLWRSLFFFFLFFLPSLHASERVVKIKRAAVGDTTEAFSFFQNIFVFFSSFKLQHLTDLLANC
jgi:hypothetical protein